MNFGMYMQFGLRGKDANAAEKGCRSQSTLTSEVVTELFIGPPTTRNGS